MKIACGTTEACRECEVTDVLSVITASDARAVLADALTDRTDLDVVNNSHVNNIVDYAYESRMDEYPTVDISVALTKAVRRISAGNCESINN